MPDQTFLNLTRARYVYLDWESETLPPGEDGHPAMELTINGRRAIIHADPYTQKPIHYGVDLVWLGEDWGLPMRSFSLGGSSPLTSNGFTDHPVIVRLVKDFFFEEREFEPREIDLPTVR